jgi:hypothetical protein
MAMTDRIEVSLILLPLAMFFYFFFSASEASAVGGISGSKLVVPETATVPKGHIEAEPFFSLEFVDDAGDTIRFGGGLRVTPGLLENLEAGVNINYLNIEDSGLIQSETNFGDIQAGAKFRLLDHENGHPFSLAYQGGVTFPVGEGALWIIEPGGLILTKNFTDKFSMDCDFVFGIIEHGSWSFVTDVGFGYYLNSWFQPVLEAAFAYEDPDSGESVWVLNLSAGFTADVSDWLIIVLGVTPDLYAQNTEKQVIVSSAFTFYF